MSFSPTSHDFGNQGVNAGPTQSFSFTLTNHGPGTSEAFLPTVDHNNFNQFEGVNSNCPQTLDPGESCHVEVVFDPSIPGPLTSDLLAETNVGVDLAAATLTGTGVIV